MDKENIGEAKKFCLEKLKAIITPVIYSNFSAMFEVAGRMKNPGRSQHATFQQRLRDVPDWPQRYIIEQATHIINGQAQKLQTLAATAMMCTAVHLANVWSVNFEQSKNQNLFKIDMVHFIHSCFIEASQVFILNPLLFPAPPLNPAEVIEKRQKAIEEINRSLERVIDSYIKIEDILASCKQKTTSNSRRSKRHPEGYLEHLEYLAKKYYHEKNQKNSQKSKKNEHKTEKKTEKKKEENSLGAYDADTFESSVLPDKTMFGIDEDTGPSEMSFTVKESYPEAEKELSEIFSYIYAPSCVGGLRSYEEVKKLMN